ncbi:MAG: hypothetical protein ACREBU_00690 [Nitrososphaera sp.]
MTSSFAAFPVHETIELQDLSDIRRAVDKMVDSYVRQSPDESFSYRILLPRGEKLTGKAKRIGVALQGELVLGLRRKNLVPNVREVRYLHDDSHYGWLLASPGVFARFENSV